jgi:GR25 family glycosyltransferase involved in LPS biosynthesis
MRQMVANDWKAVMVCEDDAVFRASRRELDTLVSAFLADEDAEVACLAFYKVSPPNLRSPLFIRAFDTQTTACYVVKRSIAADLLTVFEKGAEALTAGGNRKAHGVDMIWKQLQGHRVFVVPTFHAVVQAPGWSDVEQSYVDYGV